MMQRCTAEVKGLRPIDPVFPLNRLRLGDGSLGPDDHPDTCGAQAT